MQLAGVELVTLEVPFPPRHRHRCRRTTPDRSVRAGGRRPGRGGASVPLWVKLHQWATRGRGKRQPPTPGHRARSTAAARGDQMPAAAECSAALRELGYRRHCWAPPSRWPCSMPSCATPADPLAPSLDVGVGFGALPVGAALGIPPGQHDLGLLRQMVSGVVLAWRRSGPGVREDRAGVGPRRGHLRRARDHPDLVVQVDANGSYRLDDAEHLDRLFDLGVLCIQCSHAPAGRPGGPRAAGGGCAFLSAWTSRSPRPAESQDAIRKQLLCHGLPQSGRLGGEQATRRAHAACAEAGVAVFVGGFFETGLGRSANLALAARLAGRAGPPGGGHRQPH